jgi:UDP-N-acetylmuramoyl-tripeptide--D-alanyl-D-alanine ligase
MGYSLRDAPALLRTPAGRRELALVTYYFSMPLLAPLASIYRCTIISRTRLVAVVGSFGKTTTSRAVRAALGLSVDPRCGVTEPTFKAREIFRIRRSHPHAVIEAAIDGPGQMAKAANFMRPDLTVVTAIGTDEHHRSLGSIERIRDEKAEMVRVLPATGLAVLNGDDANVRWMKTVTRARAKTFGLGESNDIRATNVSLDWPNGTSFTLHADGQVRNLHTRLIGRHMVYPALAAVAVGLAEGRDLEQISIALAELAPTSGRMEPVRLSNGAILLRDEFKSSLETVEAALDTLAEIPAPRRLVVLGQLSEVPGSQQPIYRQVGARVAAVASRVIFLGEKRDLYMKGAARAGFPERSVLYSGNNLFDALAALRAVLREGDVVLIKARGTERLDRVALSLMGRRVSCAIQSCGLRTRCENCSMLAAGDPGIPGSGESQPA